MYLHASGSRCAIVHRELHDTMQAGTVGWSKTMIEKRKVPGSSPAWKRKDFFQPCCDSQLIGNSWPGMSNTWMWQMGLRPMAGGSDLSSRTV